MKSNYRVTVTVKGQQVGTYVVSATSPFMAKQAATKLVGSVAGELRFKVIAAK